VDVIESAQEFTVKVDLPGFTQENLDIEATEDSVVHIHAKREKVEEKKEEKYLLKERNMTEFTRDFRLPSDIQHTAVQASFEHGVLKLIIPKAAKQTPQKAKVLFQ
jgi:HSP20 family protein